MKELADGIFSDSSKKSQPRGSIWKLEGSYQPISYHHVRPGESRIQKASSVLPRSHQGSIRLGPHGKAVFGGYLPGHSRSPPVLQARKKCHPYLPVPFFVVLICASSPCRTCSLKWQRAVKTTLSRSSEFVKTREAAGTKGHLWQCITERTTPVCEEPVPVEPESTDGVPASEGGDGKGILSF